VQRTGVAIETQGFSFVTSGRRRESLTGNATLHLYPHFKPLQAMPGSPSCREFVMCCHQVWSTTSPQRYRPRSKRSSPW
jgi:hypothetical protein